MGVFENILSSDQENCFSWELKPESEIKQRKLRKPYTNMGAGRNRFKHIFRILAPLLSDYKRLIDFGSYPGTLVRTVRQSYSPKMEMTSAGYGEQDYIDSLATMNIDHLQMEFDIRHAYEEGNHLLRQDYKHLYDLAICTEVIEHQVYPLSLLAGMNKSLKMGGDLVLTTNSVSFIGDILKLLVHKHNIEPIAHSHILHDDNWRPHIRLFNIQELQLLMELCGFSVVEASYIDNGNVYVGLKGIAIGSIRGLVSVVPHLRSHIIIHAKKQSEVSPKAIEILNGQLNMFGYPAIYIS